MDRINVLDRVIILSDLHRLTGKKVIKAGTIGTVRHEINDSSMLLIQYDSDPDEQDFIGVPITSVKKVIDLDALKLVKDPFSITPKIHQVGCKFAFDNVQGSIIGTILDIELALNEADDLIHVFFEEENNTISFKRKDFEQKGSYIPFELPPFPDNEDSLNPVINHPIVKDTNDVQEEIKEKMNQESVQEIKEESETKVVSSSNDIIKTMFELIDEDSIYIKIGKFEFKVNETISINNLENLSLNDINKLQKAFTVIEKIFTK